MSLQVQFNGIQETFVASGFSTRRMFNNAPEVILSLSLLISKVQLLEMMLEKLQEKKLSAHLSWNDQSIFSGLEVIHIVSVESTEPALAVTCRFHPLPAYTPGAFVRRSRILKAQNMEALFQNYFSQWVYYSDRIGYSLQQMAFPDGDKANILQDDISDWELLYRLVGWYNQQAETDKTLTVAGQVDHPAYKLDWLQAKAYLDLGLVQDRTLDTQIRTNLAPIIKFGLGKKEITNLYGETCQPLTASFLLTWNDFNKADWESWWKKELPAFYKGHYVYAIEDHFKPDSAEVLNWNSHIQVIPGLELLPVVIPPCQTWTGRGMVTDRSSTGPWLRVELSTFETGSRTVDVRLTTVYSGQDGTEGFHLVPEKDTEVLLVKGSHWSSPVLLLHNVRSTNVRQNAPYWKLDSPGTWQFDNMEIHAKKIQATASDNITLRTEDISACIGAGQIEIS
jgi:hypothetical protein